MVVVTAGTGGAHKVLLISGKQSASTQGGYSRSISVMIPSQASSDSDSTVSGQPLRKRQRLTHLSPEEKQLRRKLKNRVAAQTARDRKKAKMGELEQQVLELELENQKLHLENRLLLEKTSDLICENEELRQRLGLDTLEEKEQVQVLESAVSDLGLVTGSSERSTQATCASAAGAGPAVPKSDDFTMDTHSPGPADTESDLLLGILDILDPELFLKTDLTEAQEAQQEFELVGGAGEQIPASPPTALGPAPVKLEALNELIHFDHIYTKPAEVVSEESICEVKNEDSVVFEVDEEIELEDQTVSVKDEPEEVVIPETDQNPDMVDDFLSDASSFSGYEKASCLTDAYSDSGYERSPSPFSNISSPLCSEGSWDDMFATELFPQLISV
ncbi:LOW QUALITY PROTEIN: X-box-binding protein 1 [Rhinichthys klamathensis goyatoka]|uniref:LOW QUALITY PROTEIN: X-box-binding protein 1 n=1 Tax=Rhinichthys klamathensis goyatoka TaxID=3034132 RepID=UPI0024B5E543|nr:LOW QUALITY PROTEIN: X-box-binding protein 1 [Rhinichthys klamathensis goyatoka]